jgi:Domain of unknown function (DUF6456)
MVEHANLNVALKAEMAEIIIYLGLGAAKITAKTQSIFVLAGKGREQLEVSAAALAKLAQRNWVKREGKLLRIADKAAVEGSDVKAQPKGRIVEPFELVENGETRIVTRNIIESPIDYLASRKDKKGIALLGKVEWSAGDRLRSDFTRANMLPAIGMRWGEPIRGSGGAGGGVNQTDAAIAARIRVNKALQAVGPEFSGLLIDVCCFLKGLEQVEAERGWPQRSAKIMLRAGLSILARHYSPPSKASAKIRTWAPDDYRASL